MNRKLFFDSNLFIFGIPFLLFAVLILIMKSSLTQDYSELSLAITIDLLVSIPLIYFLLIRKTEIPKTTIIPVMIIGMLLGYYFLPPNQQTYLEFFKDWILPLVEVFVVTFIIIKVNKVIKEFKARHNSSPDFFNTLKQTCLTILPKKLVMLFATEVAVIYYGFIKWKTKTVRENEFTYHKRSGTPAVINIIILLIAIETFVVHLLLSMWNIYAAWILSGLSIYTVLQMFGFAKSLSQRLISINKDFLTLHYGILSETEIPFSNIEHIELSKRKINNDKLSLKLSPLGELENHNVIISLKGAGTLIGLYGIQKKFTKIALHIDKPNEFVQYLQAKCSQGTNK